MTNATMFKSWLEWSLSPSIPAVLLTLLVSILLPILFHYFLYRQASTPTIPHFFLLGPANTGKTALFTLLVNGTASQTHTSQEPQTATCTLPDGLTPDSQQFRSQHDPTSRTRPALSLTDTPGHGKLRPAAIASIMEAKSRARSIIFMTDAASLSSHKGMADTANYLYDVLMSLQSAHEQQQRSSSKDDPPMAFLIAANKSDLFTSLPAHLARSGLEEELGRIRESRAKGLLVHSDDRDEEEEREWLGAGGDGPFKFDQMLDVGIDVTVLAGCVKPNSGKGDVAELLAWVAKQM